MAGWEGFGRRLKLAMIEKGFVNRRGDADVTRFALSNGWLPNYIYRYLSDQSVPERPNLEKLGEVLDVSPAWLLFGDEVSKAPLRPRKRGPKSLTCLVAALLGLTTGWGSPRLLGADTPTGSGATAENVRGITSRRRGEGCKELRELTGRAA